ncbi:MAG: phytoene/squalene synthase family protein [Anaerolineae bacterium]|nr:phytoene/squalene synthase family protein [Gloeobacterales cyanobacterium ES-bin-313]
MILESSEDRRQSLAFCQEILPDVSRTFAISIRFLPGVLGRAVLVAYLLCRIADTVEDDPVAPASKKVALLDQFMDCFEKTASANAFPKDAVAVQGEEAHIRLLRNTDLVFVVFRSLPEATRQVVHHWVDEMVQGMKKFVGLYPEGIRIQTIAEYNEYCYYVAGTVGHLLTDLWHQHSRSISKQKYDLLLVRCEAFGEALQTVNILKDIAWDAEHENSIYIPEQSLQGFGSSQQTLLHPGYLEKNHAAVASMIDIAWSDLDEAQEYLLQIPKIAAPIRLFCILPLLFAYATLREIAHSNAMLQSGGTVKITRAEVKSLILAGATAVVSNQRVRQLVNHVRHEPFVLKWAA